MVDAPDEAFIAYVAGLFDGEGCLHAAMRRTRSVQAMMTVSNIYRPVLEELQEAFGGSIHKQTGGVRQCWTWQLSINGCRTVLPMLIPHLRIKRDQAIVFLELIALQSRPYGSRRPVTDDEVAARRAKIIVLQDLKKAA